MPPVSRARRWAILLLAPAAVLAVVFAPVRPTNFAGHDEWLVISLVTRGLFGFPYASRPLDLLLTIPGAWLTPHDVLGYLVVHELYLAAAGAVMAWIAWRWLRLPAAVCLSVGVLTAVWAPKDDVRLNAIIAGRYSGTTLGVLLAAALFVAGWRRCRVGRRSSGLLLVGGGAALAAALVLGLEAALTPLVGVPLLAWAARPRDLAAASTRRRLLVCSLFWLAALALAAAPLAAAMVRHDGSYQYQRQAGLDAHPLHVASRTLHQLGAAVLPVAGSPPGELLTTTVPLAAALSLGLFVLLGPGTDSRGLRLRVRRLRLARAAVLGAALASLGWLTLSLTFRIATPARAQMLSAPGTALLLASLLGLAASWAPARTSRLVLALGGAWLVAVAAGRTAALQRQWDGRGFWTPQRASVVELIRQAPALRPNTLVVMLDQADTWRASFAFRHAVQLFYGPGVIGYVWERAPFLYPTGFEADGIRCEPWPSVRGPWRQPPTQHRYDEVVAVRLRPDHSLVLLARWPQRLPPLPPGAVYAPLARIVTAPPPASRQILQRER